MHSADIHQIHSADIHQIFTQPISPNYPLSWYATDIRSADIHEIHSANIHQISTQPRSWDHSVYPSDSRTWNIHINQEILQTISTNPCRQCALLMHSVNPFSQYTLQHSIREQPGYSYLTARRFTDDRARGIGLVINGWVGLVSTMADLIPTAIYHTIFVHHSSPSTRYHKSTMAGSYSHPPNTTKWVMRM